MYECQVAATVHNARCERSNTKERLTISAQVLPISSFSTDMKVSSTSILGFPRMGPNRDLKFALEKYWKGVIDEKALSDIVVSIEDQAWKMQKAAGIDHITVGDHYLYDGILTWTEYLGVIPARHQHLKPGLNRMFAMARGVDGATALSKYQSVVSVCGHSHALTFIALVSDKV